MFLFCPIPFQHLKPREQYLNLPSISSFRALPLLLCNLSQLSSPKTPKLSNPIFQVYAIYALIAGGHPDPLTGKSLPILEYVLKGVKCHQAEAGIISRPCLPITSSILSQLFYMELHLKPECLHASGGLLAGFFLNFCEVQNSLFRRGKVIRDLTSQSQTWPCVHV